MRTISLAALAGFSLGALLSAQEPTPVPDPPAAAPQANPAEAGQIAEHLRQLGSESFRDRMAAERALRAIGAPALGALRAAAESSDDPEVQWRARRLLRQIEDGEDGRPAAGGLRQRPDEPAPRPGQQRLPGRPLQGRDPADVHERFDRLFRDLERDFGMDIPRGRFFDDDFFGDLREQMQQMQERMRAGGAPGESKGMSMQMGPDGVRVEVVEKDADGKDQKKVYEAEDLEQFRTKFPGVLEDNGLGGGLRLFSADGRFGGGSPTLRFFGGDGRDAFDGFDFTVPPFTPRGGVPQRWDRAPTVTEMVPPPAGERLGVVVRTEIPPLLRDYLGIEHGLMVESVQDGTLAAGLGLQADDIVLRIADHAIADVADVRAALRDIAAGDEVAVHLLRQGKPLDLTAKKPAASKDAQPEGEQGVEQKTKQGSGEQSTPDGGRRVLRERVR